MDKDIVPHYASLDSLSFIPLSTVDKSLVEPQERPMELHYLTKPDCKLIEKVWAAVADHTFLTKRIYHQVFMSCPSVKRLYHFE